MRRSIFMSALLLGCAIALAACKRTKPAAPATAPATRASAAPASKPFVARSYVDLVRRAYPKMAATQPLGVPLDLDDAAHFVLSDPIYLCPRGDLWLTDPAARPMGEILRLAPDEQTHVISERVVYVHWWTDDAGHWTPRLIVRARSGRGFETLDASARKPIGDPGRAYRWDDAMSWGDRVIVPGDRGVSIFTFTPDGAENYHELIGSAEDGGPPQFVLDPRGVLAWSPADDQRPGSNGAARFVDGKWQALTPDTGWPARILHLVPLLDGSVLQIALDDSGKVKLALAPLDSGNLDEKAISDLVDQLSDADPAKRDAANAQLTRYGPASWPLLEKLLPDQPPEAKSRLRQLLRNRIEPTLGGRTLVDGKMRVADRFADGGVLFYAAAGVLIERENRPPLVVSPAWISIRPGRPIEMLDPVLVKDATPQKQHFFAFGDEWLISDSVQGPRRLEGNHLEPMLDKNEVAFGKVIGVDRRGRWLFRRADGSSGTAPSSKLSSAQTLLLDPTFPDPTPKLPVWKLDIAKGSVGWDRQDYPVIKRGGAWVLKEEGWEPLDEAKDVMITEPVAPPVSQPVSAPATWRAAATAGRVGTVGEAGGQDGAGAAPAPPILVTKDGTSYFDGRKTLRIVDRAGKQTIWNLPAAASAGAGAGAGPGAAGAGSDVPVHLIRTSDGRLFLFNQPGRVVRIKATPGGSEPFEVEAVFTHRIPNVDAPTRIWLDPAGRIIMAYEKTRLAILFPVGRIPQPIQLLITAKELEDAQN
jgi:hypothetical protein